MSNQASATGGVGFALGLHLFADHAGTVGDEAVDHGDVGSVDDAFEVVGEGDVLRHEDVGGDASSGRVGRERSGSVACAGDGEMALAIVFGHGDGEAEAAGLEGACGVGALFLDVEARVTLAVDHGGPAFAERDWGYIRQDTGVAPHAKAGGRGGCAGGDVFTQGGLFELADVVADVKGAGAEGADSLRGFGGDVVVAAGTFERSNFGHILDATGFGI